MSKKFKDPFGGVHGEEPGNSASPFKIDKEEALREIKDSLDKWDQKKVVKKSFLQKLRQGKVSDEENIKAVHWNYSKESKEYVNINLVWSKKIIRTLANVPLKQVRVALAGLKAFYTQISSVKPDINHPDVLSCYNATAENYNFQIKEIHFKDTVDVDLLDPFAGVTGEDLDIIFNNLSVDKTKALEELDFSVDFFDQIDVSSRKKDLRFIKKKPKNFCLSYKTSNEYFNIYLIWAGQKIKSIERVDKKRARVALVSLRGFVKNINTQRPDLSDPNVKLMYEATKIKHKPGKSNRNPRVELKPIEDGGMSYWSYKTHRWIIGRYDKKNRKFIPPKKNL